MHTPWWSPFPNRRPRCRLTAARKRIVNRPPPAAEAWLRNHVASTRVLVHQNLFHPAVVLENEVTQDIATSAKLTRRGEVVR